MATLGAYAFFLGAIVGSFLNVVIHRYPLGESIVFPPSHCPLCNYKIRPWDNVPIISYLLLLGRCRSCRSPITLRYPLIELGNGLFYLAIYLNTGVSWLFPLVAAVVSSLLVLIYIDLDIQILPDVIDLPGIVLGLGIGALSSSLPTGTLTLSESVIDAALGAALGGGVLLFIALVYQRLRGIEGMGMGDVKMMAMIGAVTGWRFVLPVLLLSSIAGTVVAIPSAIRSRHGMQLALPFGVFLGLGTLAVMFFGDRLTEWYTLLTYGPSLPS